MSHQFTLDFYPFSLFCPLVYIYNELHLFSFPLGEDHSMNDVTILQCRYSTGETLT